MSKSAGFTLIELMVTIAIIAVLATIGVTIYSIAQKNARDARRKGDVDAITNALEANRPPGNSSYSSLSPSQFQNNTIPTETNNTANPSAQYCYNAVTSGTTPPAPPGQGSDWTNTTACPTGPSSYSNIPTTGNVPPSQSTAWTICAYLENSIGNVGGNLPFYCRQSSQ